IGAMSDLNTNVDAGQPDQPKKNVAGEFIIPALSVVFTLYYVSTIVDSPWTAQVNAFLVGSVLLFVAAIFFIRKALALLRHEAQFQIDFSAIPRAIKTPQTAFIVVSLLYLVFVDILGFTLTTIIFFWVSMTILDSGKRPVTKAVISIIMALIGYVVFIAMFETRLPKGIIEQLIGGGV
ncbi:MAG: tripartite tricarboxylate transporter TctB family protein, partial [Alphaproteobacteria bacterium]